MRRVNLVVLLLFGVAIGMSLLTETAPRATEAVERLDLSTFAQTPPPKLLRLLFIHHSCGGQLLASPGPEQETNCICETNPNGGGLRRLLERNNYSVHEASYGSKIGQNTDIFDWLPKFSHQMQDILACDLQDTAYSNGVSNDIVVFKSCFPNNNFKSQGSDPGNPAGPELTVWNAKATYSGLLKLFEKCPRVLFVAVTAPPLAPSRQPVWKQVTKRMLRREDGDIRTGRLAREFNRWLSSKDGWLKDYPLRNVVVFDYYDILTDYSQSDLSRYATAGGFDSHPSREGNEKAAAAFVPWLNRAVRRAGLIE
jgi:hypothetical protein